MKKSKQPTISIIVTARNNGAYLKECLESCLDQTIKPKEVIYSDDLSTDNSLEVAYAIKGITVTRQMRHVGVVVARNCGVAKSSGEALVHVDGDDKLPPDFLEKHLASFTKETPFVYCAAQCFGDRDNFYRAPEWDERFIWQRNYVNTSTMMWRWVFDACGGWQETSLKTMWDWSLAIRASRMMKTPPKKSEAVLLYRQHPDSWSKKKRKEFEDYNIQHNAIRKELITMTVACIYGGRLPELMPLWLNHLIDDISILKNKPQLIIVNNSQKPIHWITDAHRQYFSDIVIISGYPKIVAETKREYREKVSTLLADCHNLVMTRASGDLIHFREDDMLTNEGAFEQLYNFIAEIDPAGRKAAVSALYLNRHHPKIVGGMYNYKEPRLARELKEYDIKPISVDFTGTGCLLYWKDVCPQKWFPFVGGNICAHDWRFGTDLKAMGKNIYILPTAVCKHIIGVEWEWVEPEPTESISPINYTRKRT